MRTVACVVMKERELNGRTPMGVPFWRGVRERYVSAEPFFE